MDITYLGAGSVRLSGRQVSIVVDPYDDSYGLAKIRSIPDVVALSSSGITNSLPAAKMVIDGPGEYEISDSLIIGIPARLHIDAPEAGDRGTIYTLEIEDVRVAVMGNIAPELTDKQLEAIGQVDVIVVPVGGYGLTLDATGAAELVTRIEPKYVVPVHYDDGKTKYPMPQDKVETFLTEMGVKPEPQAKLRISSKELPIETEVVVLKRIGEE
jgi:L-ascorbate metabolism protein UlaG (beta-lactamase superfamily)